MVRGRFGFDPVSVDLGDSRGFVVGGDQSEVAKWRRASSKVGGINLTYI
jgi:hypothetical protein